MKLKLLLFAAFLFGMCQTSSAQYYSDDKPPNFYFGMGLGIDYGGIGAKVEFLPSPYLGIFGGVGYNIAGAGVNGGLTFNVLPYHKVCPFVEAMYGYNAVIINDFYFYKSKTTYYGPSIGGGIDLKVGAKDNKFHFGIYYPIRSSQFHSDYDDLKASGSSINMLPITYSVGFNISI